MACCGTAAESRRKTLGKGGGEDGSDTPDDRDEDQAEVLKSCLFRLLLPATPGWTL